ncbi:hypothetical protein LTR09_008510 [Extremus antarcticus]|uniref:Uncharacterized protein n=1 Tax=Extremus antarcticus TaxID=702011 RepID=A0AAJ0DB05_9PEZI|nr:hypothetical protein LTR09_008510 [Extremus antarcticus]
MRNHHVLFAKKVVETVKECRKLLSLEVSLHGIKPKEMEELKKVLVDAVEDLPEGRAKRFRLLWGSEEVCATPPNAPKFVFDSWFGTWREQPASTDEKEK